MILQLIGVSEQAEKDEVVKSVINLKKTDAEEGYTMEAAAARQVKTYSITRVGQGMWLQFLDTLFLMCRIFSWMLGINFFLNQNMLVT